MEFFELILKLIALTFIGYFIVYISKRFGIPRKRGFYDYFLDDSRTVFYITWGIFIVSYIFIGIARQTVSAYYAAFLVGIFVCVIQTIIEDIRFYYEKKSRDNDDY